MCVRLLSNQYVYSDKVATLVQDAAYLHASLTGNEADAASIPISHIDGTSKPPPPTLIPLSQFMLHTINCIECLGKMPFCSADFVLTNPLLNCFFFPPLDT